MIRSFANAPLPMPGDSRRALALRSRGRATLGDGAMTAAQLLDTAPPEHGSRTDVALRIIRAWDMRDELAHMMVLGGDPYRINALQHAVHPQIAVIEKAQTIALAKPDPTPPDPKPIDLVATVDTWNRAWAIAGVVTQTSANIMAQWAQVVLTDPDGIIDQVFSSVEAVAGTVASVYGSAVALTGSRAATNTGILVLALLGVATAWWLWRKER